MDEKDIDYLKHVFCSSGFRFDELVLKNYERETDPHRRGLILDYLQHAANSEPWAYDLLVELCKRTLDREEEPPPSLVADVVVKFAHGVTRPVKSGSSGADLNEDVKMFMTEQILRQAFNKSKEEACALISDWSHEANWMASLTYEGVEKRLRETRVQKPRLKYAIVQIALVIIPDLTPPWNHANK